jgi:hypothetical protein
MSIHRTLSLEIMVQAKLRYQEAALSVAEHRMNRAKITPILKTVMFCVAIVVNQELLVKWSWVSLQFFSRDRYARAFLRLTFCYTTNSERKLMLKYLGNWMHERILGEVREQYFSN